MKKSDLKSIREEINSSLKSIGDKYGISIKTTGNTTYDSCSFRMRIEGTDVNENGESEKAILEFKRGCKLVGLEPDDFGREFMCSGKKYTISGLRLNAPKYPILAKSVDGRIYKFTESIVKRLLAS